MTRPAVQPPPGCLGAGPALSSGPREPSAPASIPCGVPVAMVTTSSPHGRHSACRWRRSLGHGCTGPCARPAEARLGRPAFPFGSGRLREYRPGELPGLRYGETRPPGSLAAGTLPQVNEDPRGGMTGVAQGEPAYREIPPATGAQVLVVSVRADPLRPASGLITRLLAIA